MSNEMATREFIEEILELRREGEGNVLSHDGRSYFHVNGGITPIMRPMPESIRVATLRGIIDLLHTERIPSGSVFAHLVSPKVVVLRSTIDHDNWEERVKYAEATCADSKFQFGRYYRHEEFIVELMTNFVQNEETAALLATLGNVIDGTVIQREEDGVTQEVHVRKGVTRKDTMAIKNPLRLAPYRTFRDVVQPSSEFVFRMKSGSDSDVGPVCALFVADGNEWELEALSTIKNWFVENAPELTVVM